MSRGTYPVGSTDPAHVAEHNWLMRMFPYGAVTADATIDALFDLIDDDGSDIVVPPGTWNISTTLTVTGRAIRAADHTSTINYTGAGVALQIATTGVRHWLPNVTKTKAWDSGGSPDRASVGVRVLNSSDNVIFGGTVSGFWVGLDVRGDADGSSYNEIHPGLLLDNMIGLRWSAVNAGWSNHNNYIGGRVRLSSSATDGVVGSRYVLGDSGVGNGNMMTGTTLESDRCEYSVEVSAGYNLFIGCRFESPSPILLSGAEAKHNQFIGGYGILDNELYGPGFYATDEVNLPLNVMVGADSDRIRRPTLLV